MNKLDEKRLLIDSIDEQMTKLFEQRIANSGVQSLNTTKGQKEAYQGTLNLVVGNVVLSDG